MESVLVSSVSRACPFLARTPVSALRQMSTLSSASVGSPIDSSSGSSGGCPHALSAATNYSQKALLSSVAAAATAAEIVSSSSTKGSQLMQAAHECPVFGKALAVQSVRRSSTSSAAHARSLATNAPHQQDSTQESIPVPPPVFESMPKVYSKPVPKPAAAPAPAPFSKKSAATFAATSAPATGTNAESIHAPGPSLFESMPKGFTEKFGTTTKPGSAFDYDYFFKDQLHKKHQDKSYRYFNNINRLAQLYPMAHTGTGEHVTVWCSNDYLGMTKHPEVVEAMKYVFLRLTVRGEKLIE
ncbi:UNVERIFIED_CONTAM: mitochondrial 5-aminolevulinate synthase [Siphonaria sp. JEL0065]|nr:mitochondrial 5-aminolevulinate synthase [Siphonaria sp. JEL0065]